MKKLPVKKPKKKLLKLKHLSLKEGEIYHDINLNIILLFLGTILIKHKKKMHVFETGTRRTTPNFMVKRQLKKIGKI